MRLSMVPSILHPRDAAADQQAAAAAAAMAAWSAGIAYAINFIVLYLTMSLAVVVVVGVMGCLASARVRKSPSFIILLFCTALCICALGINVAMNKDLVVNPQKHFNASIYTTLIAFSMTIPYLVDFTLVLRILAFFPHNSVAAAGRNRWKRWAAVAFPALIKVPRAIVICYYIQFVHTAALKASNMAEVVILVNQKQWALTEWTLMLADELYCTTFFCVKLYELGWGWGEDKHVSRNFLDTLRRILISAFACFIVPSFLLIALIVMQALKYRPDLEGYVFATFVPLTVISAAFGRSNKFLTTQRSFDTDDDKDINDKIPCSSNVELAVLEHQVVATLKHRHDDQDATPRSPEHNQTILDHDETKVNMTQRMVRPQNPLRHAPDVSGIAITTVTEEKWSEA
ncbi:uncharacterized protein UTRI_05155_B [Ustilago trichophora]|uniref:Uncharacterized protein n=1 Tax=Ustilago trichophora TaxID=86804 RepID=A0A5C3EF24_9BASI|nr:uncharacterized protein UTRI_05155_B [Ustilago trichophora]